MQRIVSLVRKKSARGNLAVAIRQVNLVIALIRREGLQTLNLLNAPFAPLNESTAYVNKVLRELRCNPRDNRLIRQTKSSRNQVLIALFPNLNATKMLLCEGCVLVPCGQRLALNDRAAALVPHLGKNDALPRNRVNAAQRQIKPNRPSHSSSALGQSYLAKRIYSQREVSGNHPSSRGGLGRASNAGARATSSH